MPPWFDSPNKRYRVILIVAICALLLGLLLAAWTALLPFFLGMLLAYLLMPIVNFLDRHAPRLLQRKGISRPLAIALVYVVGIGLIVGVVAYFVPLITDQAKSLGRAAPYYFREIQELLRYDVSELIEGLPPEIRTWVEASTANAMNTLANTLRRGLGVTVRTVSQTVSFILGMVVVPFWLFYILNDEAEVRRTFYHLIPDAARADVHCIVRIVDDLLSSYIRGQLVLCLIVGVLCTIVLVVFGVNLALLLGTVAGILEIIPILGPYLGAIPAVLMALIDKPLRAVWVALAFFAIQQTENTVLVPRVSGNAVRFHPAAVMVILVVGSEVAGLWGLLLSVPVAAVLRDVFRYLYVRTTEKGATPEMALDYLWSRRI